MDVETKKAHLESQATLGEKVLWCFEAFLIP